MRKILACLVLAAGFCSAAEAGKPDWAKPYLKLPVPDGSYIAREDEWVSLHSEVSLKLDDEGKLIRTHREVLAPLGEKSRRLSVSLDYNDATQSLVEPRVWVPGLIGYKEIKIRKSGVSVSRSGLQPVTSDRFLFVTADEIRPDEKAILSWAVREESAFPGESIVWPFDDHPAVEWIVRIEPDAEGRRPPVFLSLPAGVQAPAAGLDTGELIYRRLPAGSRLYDRMDPWFAHPLTTLPAVLVRSRAGSPDGESWPDLARLADGVFEEALASDGGEWREVVRDLVEGASSLREKIARLAGFAQSLTYRNIAWGEGAFVPEPPSETLRTRSGDCKAKSLLLKAMLAEVGVRSRLVLCRNQALYSEAPEVPSFMAFNHVVVAIQFPAGESHPAMLMEGPGATWVLFDPTDPLNVLGLPPEALEGSQALWLDPESGALFTVRTREEGAERIRARLNVSVESSEEGTFHLRLEGESRLAARLLVRGILSDEEGVQTGEVRGVLGSAAPGLEIETVRLAPADHLNGRPPLLEVEGRLRDPLRPVGSGLHTLAAPTALVGAALGVPRIGYRQPARVGVASKVEAPGFEPPEPCCQGKNVFLDGEVLLTLPSGTILAAAPALKPIDSPWLKASVEEGSPWKLEARIHRGRFAPGSAERRLAEMNQLAALLRKPFLVRETGAEPR